MHMSPIYSLFLYIFFKCEKLNACHYYILPYMPYYNNIRIIFALFIYHNRLLSCLLSWFLLF